MSYLTSIINYVWWIYALYFQNAGIVVRWNDYNREHGEYTRKMPIGMSE